MTLSENSVPGQASIDGLLSATLKGCENSGQQLSAPTYPVYVDEKA